jgi:hypothetical protein
VVLQPGYQVPVCVSARESGDRQRANRRWLGRKDSNLQPSDPESAALPLRHSPSWTAASHSKDGPLRSYSLLMTTSGFLVELSERTVMRIETAESEPISLL